MRLQDVIDLFAIRVRNRLAKSALLTSLTLLANLPLLSDQDFSASAAPRGLGSAW